MSLICRCGFTPGVDIERRTLVMSSIRFIEHSVTHRRTFQKITTLGVERLI